jgi:uncharacterized phage protein gp47/JayE
MVPDRREYFAVGRRSIVTTPGLRINPKVIDIEGSDVNIALGAMSMMGEEASAAFITCMRGVFVATSERDQLDRVVYDHFQETRLPAAPASVDLDLAFPSAGPVGTYPAGSRVQTPNGTQFALDVDAVFTGAEQILTVSATALVAGPDSNVPAGAIVQFVEQPFDATMTVTNPHGAAGGVDQETDGDFKARMLTFFVSARRGTLDAIEFGARKVPGVAVAKAYEVTNVVGGEAIPAARVQVVIADRQGGASSKMLRAVKDKELTYRAGGIPLDVLAGVVNNQAVTWKRRYLSGVNEAQVDEEVRAVTVAVAQFLSPGAPLYRAALIAGAKTVPGFVVANDSLVVPAGDVFPPSGNADLIRVPPDQVTFTA